MRFDRPDQRYATPNGFPKRTLIATAAIVTCLVFGLMINVAFDGRLNRASAVGERLAPVFTLVDQEGHAFTNAMFADKPRVILFGYTACANICPTMLSALALQIAQLGPSAADATFVFITVDPEHDTPSRLKSYIGAFSTKLVGLTGKLEDVSEVLDAYGVYRARRADGAIDHSAVALLIDAHGVLRDRIKENLLGSGAALSKLRRLIATSGYGAMKEDKRSS